MEDWYLCTEKIFLEIVKDHKIEIVYDNGFNRHLRFRNPKSFFDWFDLITWNNTLCINGDYGTFVFCRIEDMFEFFRTSINYKQNHPEKQLHINAGYWHEKLQAGDRYFGRKFSSKRFKEAVTEDFKSYFEDSSLSQEYQDDCWESIEESVLSCDENEYTAHTAANEFDYKDFSFQDFWEHDLNEYTFHFIWCLYAITWGIEQYDGQNNNKPIKITPNLKINNL